jgi:hypothetical protein
MSLQYANTYNSMAWTQVQVNPGFASTYQGPDTYSYAKNFTADPYNMNAVYAVEGTLAPSASTVIDLQNLTDFFNNPLVLTRVYGIQVGAIDADLLIKPGVTNPCQWFFSSTSEGIIVKAESDFMYNTSSAFTVTSSTSTLMLENQSASVTLTYKLALLGGEGPATSPTPTPSPSLSPTPFPTVTPVVTGTPIPTPSPSYFVTPSPTPAPT